MSTERYEKLNETKTQVVPRNAKHRWEWSNRSKKTKSYWFGQAKYCLIWRVPHDYWDRYCSDFKWPLEWLSSIASPMLEAHASDDGWFPTGEEPARSHVLYESGLPDKAILEQLASLLAKRSRVSTDLREYRRRYRERQWRFAKMHNTTSVAKWVYLGTEKRVHKFYKAHRRTRKVQWVEKTRIWKKRRLLIKPKNRTNFYIDVWSVVRVIRRRRSKIVLYWKKTGPYFRTSVHKKFGWSFGHTYTDWKRTVSEFRERIYLMEYDQVILDKKDEIASLTAQIKDLRDKLRKSFTLTGNHLCSALDDAGLYALPAQLLALPDAPATSYEANMSIVAFNGAGAGVKPGEPPHYDGQAICWHGVGVRHDEPVSTEGAWLSLFGRKVDITSTIRYQPRYDMTPKGVLEISQQIQQNALSVRNLDLAPDQFVLTRSLAELKDFKQTFSQAKTYWEWVRRPQSFYTAASGSQLARAERTLSKMAAKGMAGARESLAQVHQMQRKLPGVLKLTALTAVSIHLAYKFAIDPTIQDVKLCLEKGWEYMTTSRRNLNSLLRQITDVDRNCFVKAVKRIQNIDFCLQGHTPPESIVILDSSTIIRPQVASGYTQGVYGPYDYGEAVMPHYADTMQTSVGNWQSFSLGGFWNLADITLEGVELHRHRAKLAERQFALQERWWLDRLRSGVMPLAYANVVDARVYAHYTLEVLQNLAKRARMIKQGEWVQQTKFVKTMWELTPLSFIYDWFYNTGSIASALQNIVGARFSHIGDPVDGVWLSLQNYALLGIPEGELSAQIRLADIRWTKFRVSDFLPGSSVDRDWDNYVVQQARMDYRVVANVGKFFFDPPAVRPIQTVDGRKVGDKLSTLHSYRRVPLTQDLQSALMPRVSVRLDAGKLFTLIELAAQMLSG